MVSALLSWQASVLDDFVDVFKLAVEELMNALHLGRERNELVVLLLLLGVCEGLVNEILGKELLHPLGRLLEDLVELFNLLDELFEGHLLLGRSCLLGLRRILAGSRWQRLGLGGRGREAGLLWGRLRVSALDLLAVNVNLKDLFSAYAALMISTYDAQVFLIEREQVVCRECASLK